MRSIGFGVVTTILLLIGLAATGWADEKKWSDVAEFSFIETSGNSKISTVALKNELSYQFSEALKGLWKVGALYGKTDGETSAEQYSTELRGDYAVTEKFYSYALGGWLSDEFAGFDARYYVGPGIGYKLLTGPQHFLSAETGINYVKEEYVDGSEEEFAEGRAFAKYEFALTEKNKFSQSLEYNHDFEDSDNYKLVSETALISSISENLSLKVNYTVQYINQPVPSDLEKTNTILAIALMINY
jgi:putative salt-induced outer membrane protein